MSTHQSETLERSNRDRDAESADSSRLKRGGSTLAGLVRNGTLAVLAGIALLARSGRGSSERRARSVARAALGTALIGVGLRQRRAGDGTATTDETEPDERDSAKNVADDARAARERDDVMGQAETNPRGVSGEPDVETVTEPDEGDVRFTTEGEEPRPKPSLDDEERTDPRIDDGDGEDVEIDLSEASMADEASEATGPAPEQAEPVQVEDTEPDLSPPEDASHMQADVPDGGEGASGLETADESGDSAETTDES